MNDPHVEFLQYRLESPTSVSYENPPPVLLQTSDFNLKLENATVTVNMITHCSSESEARALVEPLLKAWELDVALQRGHKELTFVFENARLIDRNPPPPGSPIIGVLAGTVRCGFTVGTATIHATRTSYPQPPTSFKRSPDVDTMWGRYDGYKQNRERLAAMAYFCLTVLTRRAKGERQLAKLYKIDPNILKELSRLSSIIGDSDSARKLSTSSIIRPHSSKEIQWIEAVVRALIRRTAEYDADPSALIPITMADLPPL